MILSKIKSNFEKSYEHANLKKVKREYTGNINQKMFPIASKEVLWANILETLSGFVLIS